MHSLPALRQALGQANVHETAEVKKSEQLPAKKETAGLQKKLKNCALPQKWASGNVTFQIVVSKDRGSTFQNSKFSVVTFK